MSFFRTSIAVALSSLLLMSAAGTTKAGEIVVATAQKKTTTYSPDLINQARRANQARSGNDDEWDDCMEKAEGDFVDKLAACFCLTTPQAPCGEDHSEPGN